MPPADHTWASRESARLAWIWFSPHCLPLTESQTSLDFEVPA